jgi:hypothetical protein
MHIGYLIHDHRVLNKISQKMISMGSENDYCLQYSLE